ncbi:TMV resistance protein N-like [Senna tora]|uniref:ADP-ribosyl cyclase/cyclic ADP-ribose hydrolase n=1 Tax=Senna tora TaxID=362788 RepID=A0A835CM09_9FABA|nr:TMV resistance protein N-like [Senna tora]
MSSSSSSSNPQTWNYDVFFSFTIENNFTSHLKSSLSGANFRTFMDNHDLHRRRESGDEVKPCVLRAMEASRISIVVLAEEYGECIGFLERVEKVMECHRRMGQVVLPIYYEVDLWEVRKQSGEFGEAFERLIKGMRVAKEKEVRWRRELTEFTLLPHCGVSSFSVESRLRRVVRFDRQFPSVLKIFLGREILMDKEMQKMKLLCCLWLNNNLSAMLELSELAISDVAIITVVRGGVRVCLSVGSQTKAKEVISPVLAFLVLF